MFFVFHFVKLMIIEVMKLKAEITKEVRKSCNRRRTVNEKEFYFIDEKGKSIYTKKWHSEGIEIVGVIQIAHGLGETVEYYDELANFFAERGYAVYINEALGHGRTAGDIKDPNYKFSGGDAGIDCINHMVDDLKKLTGIIKKQNPDKPVFLIGHSFGSVLAQIYAYRYGEELNGVIYSGVLGCIKKEKLDSLINVAETESEELGRHASSRKAFNEFFAHANDQFNVIGTGFEWITSDKQLLKESLESPYANIPFNVGFYVDFAHSIKDVTDEKNIKEIPKDLPVFSVSGGNDYFSDNGENVIKLINKYKEVGIENVSFKIYRGKRHSILREVNRNVVYRDILKWIEKQI